MNILAAGLIAAFLGLFFLLYYTRKSANTWGRLLIVLGMMGSLGGSILLTEHQRETTEPVWHPKALAWEQIPVEVYWDRTVFHDYNETFEQSVNIWNDRVGCEVLRVTHQRESARIHIRPFDGTECGKEVFGIAEIEEDSGALASAWYCGTHVDIQMKRLDEVRLAFRIALHELGHGIGLGHDDTGAMAKKVIDPQLGDPPEYLLPSNKDAASIKARYCH
jgi:hypothetical protein